MPSIPAPVQSEFFQADGLAEVGAGDAGAFVAACERSQARSAVQFFPRLYFHGRSRTHPLRWERHDGSILVYQFRQVRGAWRMNLYLPPLPFSAAALGHATERMADHNADRMGMIMRVPEGEALAILRAGMSVRFREDEYIYDRAAVLACEGPEFRSLRKSLGCARKHGSVETRPFVKDDRPACLALVDAWRDRIVAAKMPIGGYFETIACVKNAHRFAPPLLRGLVVEVNGAIRGFAFSGHLAGAMGCNYLRITDTDYSGLPQLLACRLMEEFPEHVHFNDSTDAGRPGLRELKNRFRPVQMLGVFTALQH